VEDAALLGGLAAQELVVHRVVRPLDGLWVGRRGREREKEGEEE
jgi:hypothetical protein